MQPTALVTGADRGLGHALCAGLLERGWQVCAGQYMPDWPELSALSSQFPGSLHIIPLDVSSLESTQAAAQMAAAAMDHIDLLIHNAGVGGGHGTLRKGHDYAAIHRAYDVNALGAVRIAGACLPLMEQGKRRLAFVSSEAGSVTLAHRQAGFGYCMSKAALNMAVKMLFNLLRPEGYTFRVYHPGWMRSCMRGVKGTRGDLESEEAAVPALAYFLRARAADPHNPARHEEDRLVMRDWQGCEWPW